MIKSADKIWDEVGEINNLEFEYHYLGEDQDIPVLIAKDVFKYPDKVVEFGKYLHSFLINLLTNYPKELVKYLVFLDLKFLMCMHLQLVGR